MQRRTHSAAVLVSLVIGTSWLAAILAKDAAPAKPKSLAITLEQVERGETRIVDLTYALNERNAYWPAPGYSPFQQSTIATLEQNGVLSKSFAMPEHLGTHLDAPNHFEKDRPSVAEIPASELFGPGIVIDISNQADQDADYRLSPRDVAAWEEEHGRIPDRAIVLLHTGWGRHWTNFTRYKNQDVEGRLHFPSYSVEAARFLIEQRHVRGIGVETLSIHYGISRDSAVHHLVNSASRFCLENVARLNELPPRGFHLIVAPIKIETGTGGPARIFAVLAPSAKDEKPE